MSYERERQVALEAVVSAARLCEQVRRETSLETIDKEDGTPVTLADFGSQAVICRAIAEAFPADSIVAEENTAQLGEPDMADRLENVTAYVQRILPGSTPHSVAHWINRGSGVVRRRYWALDPLDGTKGFLRGDQYAVAVALVEEGKVKVGILGCPSLPINPGEPEGKGGALFVGVRGQGATMFPLDGRLPRAIQVASGENNANLPFVESVESAHCDHNQQREVAKAVGIQIPSLRVDGQAKYGMVARGEAILYLRFPLSPSSTYLEKVWDHAAGAILVEEAGGCVTDMQGRPLDFSRGPDLIDNQGIVAGNAFIHARVLETLKSRRY